MAQKSLSQHSLGEWYSLEFSQYSENQVRYPYHVGPLHDAVEHNLIDFYHNNRGENKWQIIFIGTFEECNDAIKTLTENKRMGKS